MSVFHRQKIGEYEEIGRRRWIVYDRDEDIVRFCEDCVMFDDEVLTNTGLTLSGKEWRGLMSGMEKNGISTSASCAMVRFADNRVIVIWVTREDQLNMGSSYAPGRLLEILVNRNDLCID